MKNADRLRIKKQPQSLVNQGFGDFLFAEKIKDKFVTGILK